MLSADYLPLDENDVKNIRTRIQEQNNAKVQKEPPIINYRFFVENRYRTFPWSKFPYVQNQPIWYYVCEALEKVFMNQFYTKLQKERHFRLIDPGAFIALWEHDVNKVSTHELTDKEWRSKTMISPFYDFNQSSSHCIVLIRLPRNERLNIYNKKFQHGWLYKIFERFPPCHSRSENENEQTEEYESDLNLNEDQKLALLMDNTAKTLHTQTALENQRKEWLKNAYVLKLANSDSKQIFNSLSTIYKTKSGRDCRFIYNAFPTSIPKTNFVKLSNVEHLLRDEDLKQLILYLNDGIEYIKRVEIQGINK